MNTSIVARIIVGIEITAPGFIHSFSEMFPRFLLSSIPAATMFAVLPNDKVILRQGPTQNEDGPDRTHYNSVHFSGPSGTKI